MIDLPHSRPRCTKADANWATDGVCREQAQAAHDPGRHRLESQPSSRTGENPPYGMIGRIEETSASFEARYAPRSYPTTFGSKSTKLRVSTTSPLSLRNSPSKWTSPIGGFEPTSRRSL